MNNSNFKVFAIDISGSTSGEREYYQNVEQILNKMYKDGDLIIEWNGEANKVTRSSIQTRINGRNGTGWTSPSAIIKYLANNSIKEIHHFILITDGEVSVNEVDNCDSEIKSQCMTFERFDGFIIGSKRSANMSVTCPFTRFCSHTVTQIEPGTQPETIADVSAEDFAIIEKIKTIDDIDVFMSSYPTMERVFAARLLGTVGDQELRKEVVKMQHRITDNMAKKSAKDDENALLMKSIESGDIQNSLALAGKLLQIQNTEYEKCINALIRMCDGGLRQTFDATQIKSFRAKIADQAETVEVIDVDDAPTYVQTTFECPVSYESETDPVILIARPNQPILNLIDNKFSTDNVINCPLDIFLCKEPLEAMKECVDHPLSLKSMREAENCGQPIAISPLTRKNLIGGLPLGASEEHVKAANWTLFQLTSGGKRLGNPDMWFAVIWTMIERNMLPFLNDVLPFVREQMIFRLKNHLTAASLTGLSTFCQKRLPLIGSCWFCLSSPFFITKETRNQNMLRFHLSHAQILKKMIDLVGYKLPDGFDRVLSRSIAFASMLRFKRDHRESFDTMIRCLYQNSIHFEVSEDDKTNHVFIPIDGPATEQSRDEVFKILPGACKKLELNELVWLSTFIDIQKSATENTFPMTEDAPPLPKFAINWSHVDAKFQVFEDIKICPKTMRPYCLIDGVEWSEIYYKQFGEGTLMLIGCDAAFCKYVNTHGCFPTADQYIISYSKRLSSMSNPISSLPSKIVEIVGFRIKAFQKAIADAGNIDATEVSKRFNDSCSIEKRKLIEM